MHYDKTDVLLSAAFKVVKQYDPKRYARMARDDSWFIVSMSGDFGYGETLSSANAGLNGNAYTRISPTEIKDASKRYDLHESMFAAAVLAHEYRHAHQPVDVVVDTDKAESQAFHAGSAFAEKLPLPDGAFIKALSDETLATMHTNPGYIMQGMMNNS